MASRAAFPVFLVASGPPLAALLAWSEGHGKCGGLTCDDRLISCACGTGLFEITEVAA